MARIIALDILKAAPQHAQTLGSSGLAMLMAITGQWDTLGCTVAVCWSNSRMSERTGLSRNSIDVVRSRLVKAGWLSYIQDGRQAGHYIPQLPDYHAQMSAVECASGAQFTVQVLCNDCATTVQLSVQPLRSSLGSYIPSPSPSPVPVPEPIAIAAAPVAKAPKVKTETDLILEKHKYKFDGPKPERKVTINHILKTITADELDEFLTQLSKPLWPVPMVAEAIRWAALPLVQPPRQKAPPINLDFT